MDYISIKEASERWGIDTSRIGVLAREGRIEGAIIVGRNWLIPADAQKPNDLRKNKYINDAKSYSFRFPVFICQAKDKFNPPLSSDELALKKAQANFYKCDFKKAQESFTKLCDTSTNIYVKICAAFYMCIIIAASKTDVKWNDYYLKLITSFTEDFEYKTEMELFKPLLDTYLGMYNSASKKLSLKQNYKYHESSFYTYSYISFFHLLDSSSFELDLKNLELYEVLCQKMEDDGHILEAQSLHRILFVAYLLKQNNEQMLYHLRYVISIAQKYNLLYIAAEFEPYYSEYYSIVLEKYPEDFRNKIRKYGKEILDNFTVFNKKYTSSILYSELNEKDYQIILYKIQGYLNKQIAVKMSLSERTIANRLSIIYDKLNIKNKNDLIGVINNAL